MIRPHIGLVMMDEVRRRGLVLDTKRLSALLGVPVVETVARAGEGKDALVREAVAFASERRGAWKPLVLSYGADIDRTLADMKLVERYRALPVVFLSDVLWFEDKRLKKLKMEHHRITREALVELIAQGQERGEIRTDIRPEELFIHFLGLIAMVTTQGRLLSADAFENIILRAEPDGSTLRLKDVARVELGSKDYSFVGKLAGHPAVPVGIFLSPGANALETADRVVAKLAELSKTFPDGITYDIPHDTTEFVRISIHEVIHTLIEAMLVNIERLGDEAVNIARRVLVLTRESRQPIHGNLRNLAELAVELTRASIGCYMERPKNSRHSVREYLGMG